MRQIIIALVVIAAVVTLIVAAFTITQVASEEQRLKTDLEYRSILLAESLKETVEPNFINRSQSNLQGIVSRFSDKERFASIGIYDNKGNIIAGVATSPEASMAAQEVATTAMDSDKAGGNFVDIAGRDMYMLAIPLRDNQSVVGALMLSQNASYINERLSEIWKNNLIRLVIQTTLLSLATLLLIRWIIYQPIINMVEALRQARSGDTKQKSQNFSGSFFFRPLFNEVSNIRRSLLEARSSASEEARLRLEQIDSAWTTERLKSFLKDILKGRKIFMVSNREPYIHTKENGNISYYFPASGMATAIEPVMRACEGVWIAHGSGNADKLVVDKYSRIQVPPDEPKYTLRRVWMTEKEESGFYYGFSNEGIWPLCHIAHTRPIFRKEDWEEYQKINQRFADTVLSETKDQTRPVILIQDFQLALVPQMVKSKKPGATVGLFWHIPWPNPESFSICPWKKEILDGMLGADLIGFHTQLHCNNFIETVGRELESLIDFEQFTITRNGHTSSIKPFPISIAFTNGTEDESEEDTNLKKEKLIKDLGIKSGYIGLGIDRLDYTKGILERLKAIEIFLTTYPSFKSKFTFVQIAAPSRTKVKKYQEFAVDVREEVERINSLFKTNGWKPIILLEKHHSHEDVRIFYKIADFCLVSSLHDGMNLVAKEFVAARSDEKGVLILSQFTGASRELKDALIVNPYNGEQTASAIKQALEMKPAEQTKRMRNMREILKNNNVFRWSAELLKAMVNLG